jgi:hypothetical protein
MAEQASATITAVQDGEDWQYSLTLNDIGSEPIGTFWFSWVPGEDFLATRPISVTDPAGWTDSITNFGPSDGFAIQWVASSGTLAAGDSLTGFSFTSADPPASVFGNSVFFPGTPVLTSFVYEGAPFVGDSFQFQATPACFRAGTRIRTERGPVAVEALVVGDRVPVLLGGTSRPIIWLGHRRVDCRHHPDPRQVWPIRVCAGAFGPGRPFRDLCLSPDHALFIDGVLVPVHCLVNGRTIFQQACDEVTYWHVELAEHDVLYAEGVPAESYLDTGNRGAFSNGGPAVALHPDFGRAVWETRGCARLVQEGPRLASAKHRVLTRAAALGHATTSDPSLTVRVNGKQRTITNDGSTWRVRLPRTTRDVRLTSRVWIPAHMRPDSDDARILGVAVSRLWLDRCEVALDSPVFASGWHDIEQYWRWTDGDGLLAVAGARELEFEVKMTGTYWQHDGTHAARVA